jgi:hypothetical protein
MTGQEILGRGAGLGPKAAAQLDGSGNRQHQWPAGLFSNLQGLSKDAGTAVGSDSAVNSTSQTPWLYKFRTLAATRSASRDFPTPPAPTSVTSRAWASSSSSCSNSCSRPTKLLVSAGRLYLARTVGSIRGPWALAI